MFVVVILVVAVEHGCGGDSLVWCDVCRPTTSDKKGNNVVCVGFSCATMLVRKLSRRLHRGKDLSGKSLRVSSRLVQLEELIELVYRFGSGLGISRHVEDSIV